jgi:pyruvate ferredoxin oxidoreductase gamma subunit
MHKTIDNPVVRGMLVTAIATLLAGSAVAEAKGEPHGVGQAIEVTGPGAGYGSSHGSGRVRAVQHLLRRAGEHPGPVDGRFGPLTEAAVERFQAREGLAVDGTVGEATKGKLARYSTGAQKPSDPSATGKAAAPRAAGPRLESVSKRPARELPVWFRLATAGALVLAGALALTRRFARPTRHQQAVEVPPFQVSIHGRGVLPAAELLSVAALVEGRNALAFPSLQSGQTGPHVVAFCRIGGASIRPHEPIRPADGLIVEDPELLLMSGRFNWLRPEGYLLINPTRSIEELGLRRVAARLRAERSLSLPASELAREHLGVPAPDTALVGGFVALSGVVSLTSVVGSIRERFPGTSVDANVAVAEAAFDYVLHELERLAPPRKGVKAQKHPA